MSQSPTGEGPEVYRLAQAYRPEQAAARISRLLRAEVTSINRSEAGSSHAVFLATLADGREVVGRFATHPDHALDREVWVTERCRSQGLPVPLLLGVQLDPVDDAPPFALYERLPGLPGHLVSLSPRERIAVLEQMGEVALQLHSIKVRGVGNLEAAENGEWHAANAGTWARFSRERLEAHLQDLPAGAMPGSTSEWVRAAFEAEAKLLDEALPTQTTDSSLVHGDFRLENALLVKDSPRGPRVNGIVDFEMALAGDGIVDLAWLYYQDGRRPADLEAILRGYGASPENESLSRRLILYQLHYAVNHLWWEANFHDADGIERVLGRIRGFLAQLGQIGEAEIKQAR